MNGSTTATFARPTATPKQTPTRDDRDWYPYYAAYSQPFVDSVLDAQLADATKILDPWTGSGTTNATCHRRGVCSVGLDINPASIVIAKGRLATARADADNPAAPVELFHLASRTAVEPAPVDPLLHWFLPDAVERIRSLERAAHVALSFQRGDSPCQPNHAWLTALPADLCFVYCVLFFVVRNMLRPYATTNPMWFKMPTSSRSGHKLGPSWLQLNRRYQHAWEFLSGRLSAPVDRPPNTELGIGSATDLPFTSDQFDGVLTSPPYATRVDYVKGMLPELAVLGVRQDELSKLRTTTTGTPVVRRTSRITADSSIQSESGRTVLARIRDHSSKGSRNYYHPWMRNYLAELQTSIKELNRVTTKSSTICLVVQNSYYKDVRIDLQDIVEELFLGVGRALAARHDYSAPNPRSPARSTAGSNGRSTCESLLVFQ